MKPDAQPDSAEWLQEIVDRHAAPLFRYAVSILRDEAGARDVVQETFVRLWRQPRASIEGHVQAWLFRVCRNKAFDHRRKEERMRPLGDAGESADGIAAGPNPDGAAELRDTHARVLQLMEALPENQREVVRLKFQNDLSYKEIAEITELSVGNVGYLLHTALKTLRTRLLAAGD